MIDLLTNTPFNEYDVKAFFLKNDNLFPDPFANHVDINQYVDKILCFGNIIIAHDGTRIMGITGGYANDFDTYCAHLQFLLVDGANQGKGYGYHLLQSFIDFSRNQGMKSVVLTVDNSNQNAKELYLKAGFVDSEMKHSNPNKTLMKYFI